MNITIKNSIIVGFFFFWILSILYAFWFQVNSISWATFVSFIVFPIIGLILLFIDWKNNPQEIITQASDLFVNIFYFMLLLGILFIIGVIVFAVIKWAFLTVFSG